MATRTAAAIVVLNVSHDGAQYGRGGLDGWHNTEPERQGSDWGKADDAVMELLLFLCSFEEFNTPTGAKITLFVSVSTIINLLLRLYKWGILI